MGKNKGRSKASRSKRSSLKNSRNALSGSSQVGCSSTEADIVPVLDQDIPMEQQGMDLTSEPRLEAKSFPVSVSKTDLKQAKLSGLTESQLEEILLYKLDLSYKEAVNNLIGYGCNEFCATRAVLSSGNCVGPFDPVTNILLKCLPHLSPTSQCERTTNTSLPDLHQFTDFSLLVLVKCTQGECDVCQLLSRDGAMRVLLACNLDYGQIISKKIENFKIDLVKTINSSHNFVMNEMPTEPEAEEMSVKSDTRANRDTEFQLKMEDETEVQSDAEKHKYETDVDEILRLVWEQENQIKKRAEWAQNRVLEAFKQEELALNTKIKSLKEENTRLISDKVANELLNEEHDKETKGWKEVGRLRKRVENAKRERVEIEEEIQAVENEISIAKQKLAEEKRSKEEVEMLLKAASQILESTKKCIAASLKKVARKLETEQKDIQDKLEETKKLEAEREALAKIERQCEASDLEEAVQKIEVVESKLPHELEAIANCTSSNQLAEMKEYNLWGELDVTADTVGHFDSQLQAKEATTSAPTTNLSSSNGESNLRYPCTYCREAEARVLVLPCAHMMLCKKCGEQMHQYSVYECYSCHQKVDEIIFINDHRSS